MMMHIHKMITQRLEKMSREQERFQKAAMIQRSGTSFADQHFLLEHRSFFAAAQQFRPSQSRQSCQVLVENENLEIEGFHCFVRAAHPQIRIRRGKDSERNYVAEFCGNGTGMIQ